MDIAAIRSYRCSIKIISRVIKDTQRRNSGSFLHHSSKERNGGSLKGTEETETNAIDFELNKRSIRYSDRRNVANQRTILDLSQMLDTF